MGMHELVVRGFWPFPSAVAGVFIALWLVPLVRCGDVVHVCSQLPEYRAVFDATIEPAGATNLELTIDPTGRPAAYRVRSNRSATPRSSAHSTARSAFYCRRCPNPAACHSQKRE